MAEFTPGQLYNTDPNDSTKQTVISSSAQPMPSFVGFYTTDAEVEALDAVQGSMAYSSQQTHGRLYVYDGTTWKYVTFSG